MQKTNKIRKILQGTSEKLAEIEKKRRVIISYLNEQFRQKKLKEIRASLHI